MELLGNHKSVARLNDMVLSQNFSHAYLFVGPKNIGKTEIAKNFGQKLVCEQGSACGECGECKLILAGNHPDFMLFDGEETLTVDEIRELIHFLELKPYQAKRKVAIITHSDRMTEQAANSLLKTLEEPAKNTVIIQTAENPKNLLDTIISRSQLMSFGVLNDSEMETVIGQTDDAESDFIRIVAAGRPGVAIELLQKNQETAELKELVGCFEKVYSQGSIYEKLNLASELAGKKEEIGIFLDILEAYFRHKLLTEPENSLKMIAILDKLTETKDLINKNINLQLALESLLLNGE